MTDMTQGSKTHEGGCACGGVRYRMRSEPMIVHCCHCTWCQRESGSAFAINALIERDRVELLGGEVKLVDIPSASGKGQRVARCPECQVAVFSHYAYGTIADSMCFVRVGTLDEPGRLPPDVHVFTSSKQPWVVLPPDIPALENFYRASEVWSEQGLQRRAALFAAAKAAGGSDSH